MVTEPISLLGGKSVHCINELQMAEAERLAFDDPVSSRTIQTAIEHLEKHFTRNELAAIALVVIKRLKATPPAHSPSDCTGQLPA